MHRFSNNAVSTLAAGIDGFVTTIALTMNGGALFSVPPTEDGTFQLATLTHASVPGVYEVVRLIANPAADTFTVERGVEGSPIAWPAGTEVSARVTAGMLSAFIQSRIGAPVIMDPSGGTIVLGSGSGDTSGATAGTFVARGVSRANNAWVIGGQSVVQHAHAQDLSFSPTLAYEAVGTTHPVDLGVPLAWNVAHNYIRGRVVRPTTPNGYQYWARIASLTEDALYSATEPAFPGNGNPAEVVPLGEWVATAMPVTITRDFPHLLVVTEVGFINHMYGATSSPTVSIGVTGDATRFANAVPLSQITAQGHIHRIPITTGGAPADDLVFRVDTAATGGVFMGRFYFKGFFVETSGEFI